MFELTQKTHAHTSVEADENYGPTITSQKRKRGLLAKLMEEMEKTLQKMVVMKTQHLWWKKLIRRNKVIHDVLMGQ